MQDSASAWEASAEAEEAERTSRPARTSETIPVPAPSSSKWPHKVSRKWLMWVVIINVDTMAHLIR